MRNQPGDLLPKLSDALLQLRLLALARLSPDIEQPLLARHEQRHVWIGRALGQFLGKDDLVRTVALRLFARLTRHELVEAFGVDRQVGAGLGIVETHDHLAGLHDVAVVDEQLADDAAGRVLNFLDVGVDDDHAGSDHGARQLGGGRPAADAQREENGRGGARNEMRADGSGAFHRLRAWHCLRPRRQSVAENAGSVPTLSC